MEMTCAGEGDATVVLEAGLDTSGATFIDLADVLSETMRVCYSDRAGVSLSPPLSDDAPDPSPGSSADALAAELDRRDEPGPYVVLGWSYGGLVAQAFALRHPDLTAGLVLEDSATPEQFLDPAWGSDDWVDGGRSVDRSAVVAELSTIDLGDLPLLVLTSEQLRGHLRRLWDGYQVRLAGSSSDAVLVLGVGSRHAMHLSSPDLVAAAVTDVARAVTSGSSLGPCGGRYDDVGGRCLSPVGG
jgi:pimeloyl-ACP methyl ester carboxylesterase